ncbi:hypothetical protein V5O48_009501 [Marasmius crinis-equi]|uniref:Rho-GAP domain-containing protein n=1 Tax=Marasmius crinis-equi TaxID=585013 RepID=A0ABR3FAY7_9AGAR
MPQFNGISLKQRLEALAVSPSSSSSSLSTSPSSSHYDQSYREPASPSSYTVRSMKSPLRSSFFGGFGGMGSWPRRSMSPAQPETPTGGFSGGNEMEMVQEIMGKLIFQAGVDYETRPMVVVNASALPDFSQAGTLVLRFIWYLPSSLHIERTANSSTTSLFFHARPCVDCTVESDYTVIFFAAGVKHTPGWNWVWKAYRSLSRKYRKNLKRLYVVHSTFFSKMLFSLAGAVISPKFFRKLTYVSTLSELAYHIPITQIDIPPAAYAENLRHESTITLPSQHTFSSNTPQGVSTPTQIFGIALEDLMGFEGEKGGVPRVVKDAVAYIRESGGIQDEGIFRRSPSSAMLRSVMEAYDRGNVVSLDTFNDPHLAAVLLKKYLRDLPEPIFPENLYPVIRRCPPPLKENSPIEDPNEGDPVAYVREVLLKELKPCVYILLSVVLQILHETSLHSSANRMDAYNLAVVITPNLVKGSSPLRDVMICAVQGGPPGPSQSTLAAPVPQIPHSANGNVTPSLGVSPPQPSTPTTPRVSVITSTPTASPPPPSSPAPPANTNTTLGTIIKLCIEHFYEVFDEVRDPTEVISPFSNPFSLSNPANTIPEEGQFVSGRGNGKEAIGRGFGFGMDMELSGSDTEAENVNTQGRVDLDGFRFGGGTVGRAFSNAAKRLSLTVPNSQDEFDTDEVLFAKISLQHHRRQSSGLRSHRSNPSHRSTHSMRSTGTAGTTGTTDDEEIDDAMLVMPLGPPSPRQAMFMHQQQQQQGSTSLSPTSPTYPQTTTNGSQGQRFTTIGSNYATYKRKRAPLSSFYAPPSSFQASSSHSSDSPKKVSSTPSSIHSHSSSGFMPKARSVISIENGSTGRFGGTISGIGKGGGGSIVVGRNTLRGTTKKSIGASVEAVGITAEGFFSAPSSASTQEEAKVDGAATVSDAAEGASESDAVVENGGSDVAAPSTGNKSEQAEGSQPAS